VTTGLFLSVISHTSRNRLSNFEANSIVAAAKKSRAILISRYLLYACAVCPFAQTKDGRRFTEIVSFSPFWPTHELVGIKSVQQWRCYTSPHIWLSFRSKLATQSPASTMVRFIQSIFLHTEFLQQCRSKTGGRQFNDWHVWYPPQSRSHHISTKAWISRGL
jgi:hypothetical protein